MPDGSPQKDDPYIQEMARNAERGFVEHIPINFVFKALSDKTSYTLLVKSLLKKGEFPGNPA